MARTAEFVARLQRGIPQKLVVFGTSLSYHLAPPLRAALGEHFGEALSLVNSGMSARASRSALAELENRVLAHQPDVLTLEFAVNDAYSYEDFPDATLDKGIDLQESRANLQKLVARVQNALPDCEIWVITTNPTFDAPQSTALAGSRRPDLADFYRNYRQTARESGLNLLDLEAFWNQHPNELRDAIPDGAHPNPTALRTLIVPEILRIWGV